MMMAIKPDQRRIVATVAIIPASVKPRRLSNNRRDHAMANKFRFNRKEMGSIVIEGERVDIMGSTLTVVDEQGHALASFEESTLRAWWQVQEVAGLGESASVSGGAAKSLRSAVKNIA